jgi:hypothetical protein
MADGYITQSRTLNPGQIKGDPSIYDTSGFTIYNGGSASNVVMDLRTSQTTTSYRAGLLDLSSLTTGQEQLRFLMGNYSWENSHPGDTGHVFSTTKTLKTVSTFKQFSRVIGGKTYAFSGYLYPSGTLTLPSVPSFQEVSQGQRFINACAPTLPRANLLVSFAELAREGFSAIPGTSFIQALATRSSFFRSIGNEYLNVEFGWKPFVNELLAIMKSVRNANYALLQLEENSGKVVVRSRSTPLSTTFSSSVTIGNGTVNVGTNAVNIGGGAWDAIYQGGAAGRVGSSTLHQWTSQDTRFKGAFTYLLSPGTTLMSRFERYEQMANHLLGIRLTPEVLWELSPWSWLIDWFVDIQTALRTSELLNSDGLVMKYGYMTRKYIRGVSRTSSVQFLGESPSVHSKSNVEITKIRYRATPYGFGLNPNSFTSSQWAILAALGLTKAPRSLF